MNFLQTISGAVFSLIVTGGGLALITHHTVKFAIKPPLWTPIPINIAAIHDGENIWIGLLGNSDKYHNKFVQRLIQGKIKFKA